jgi:hypothetical protein
VRQGDNIMNTATGPDYGFWSRLEAWSYRDAALLLCGFDPDQARGSGIRLDRGEVPPQYTEASKVYRILRSGAGPGEPAAHPFTVIEHALRKGLPLPAPLLEAVRERFRRERAGARQATLDVLDTAETGEPHPRTRRFLLHLIYVLATQGYGLKLDMPYNDSREIAEEAERLGLALDRSTIAHYLTEARKLSESAALTE